MDGNLMGPGRSSKRTDATRALLFIITVSRWGPWYADPLNKYPRYPRVRPGVGGRVDPLRFAPGVCFILMIIGFAVIASGDVQAIVCLPIIAVLGVIGAVAFYFRSKGSKKKRLRPPIHHHHNKR